ncbi:DUF4890 domain-containing protein [Bacteroides fluxus]|nr:DUF4890 domain-containing protein [Bacteroides fluxus]
MKKIVLMLVAAFFMGGAVMAQHARRGDKMPDPKVRAERMTERMAKEYSLDDNQKKQLLEANLAFVEKMGNRPGKHHRKENRVAKKEGKRPQLTDEQRAERKAEIEKRHEEMKAARTDYDAQLQKIMTKEQYAAYSKKMQERKTKMESKRKEAVKA